MNPNPNSQTQNEVHSPKLSNQQVSDILFGRVSPKDIEPEIPTLQSVRPLHQQILQTTAYKAEEIYLSTPTLEPKLSNQQVSDILFGRVSPKDIEPEIPTLQSVRPLHQQILQTTAYKAEEVYLSTPTLEPKLSNQQVSDILFGRVSPKDIELEISTSKSVRPLHQQVLQTTPFKENAFDVQPKPQAENPTSNFISGMTQTFSFEKLQSAFTPLNTREAFRTLFATVALLGVTDTAVSQDMPELVPSEGSVLSEPNQNNEGSGVTQTVEEVPANSETPVSVENRETFNPIFSVQNANFKQTISQVHNPQASLLSSPDNSTEYRINDFSGLTFAVNTLDEGPSGNLKFYRDGGLRFRSLPHDATGIEIIGTAMVLMTDITGGEPVPVKMAQISYNGKVGYVHPGFLIQEGISTNTQEVSRNNAPSAPAEPTPEPESIQQAETEQAENIDITPGPNGEQPEQIVENCSPEPTDSPGPILYQIPDSLLELQNTYSTMYDHLFSIRYAVGGIESNTPRVAYFDNPNSVYVQAGPTGTMSRLLPQVPVIQGVSLDNIIPENFDLQILQLVQDRTVTLDQITTFASSLDSLIRAVRDARDFAPSPEVRNYLNEKLVYFRTFRTSFRQFSANLDEHRVQTQTDNTECVTNDQPTEIQIEASNESQQEVVSPQDTGRTGSKNSILRKGINFIKGLFK